MAARRGIKAIAAVDVKNASTRDNFVPLVSEHVPGHLTWLSKDQCSSESDRTTSISPLGTPRVITAGKGTCGSYNNRIVTEGTKITLTSAWAVGSFLSSVCLTSINLIQHWLMAACSSRQMGLAAPPGTYRTLQGHLYGGRCCLGEDLVQACAESMYFSGSLYWQNNYSDQRVIHNCPPATGFLREDVGMSTAIPCTHTAPHTTLVSLFSACRTLLWHKSWGLFSKEVIYTGGRKNAAPTTVSPHLMQKPGGLPTNCHNFFMNSSGLPAWSSLWPYKQTLMLMWLHSLWLAFSQRTALMQLLRPI